MPFLLGGKGGIRTLGRVLADTRFPVVRLRPAQPSLHLLSLRIFKRLNIIAQVVAVCQEVNQKKWVKQEKNTFCIGGRFF